LSLAVLAAVALAGIVLIAWWTAPTNLTSMENYDKIASGMTQAEVVAVLGSEGIGGTLAATLEGAGDRLANIEMISLGVFDLKSITWKQWQTRDHHGIAVGFDRTGRAAVKASFLVVEDWPAKIRRWLRLGTANP
jgi:hypothetical protein